MIRLIGILIGLFFAGCVLLWSLIPGIGAVAPVIAEYGHFVEPTAAHDFHKHPEKVNFSSDGPFGTWDLQQLQRGYQVYKEVCSACHSLEHVALRDLAQLGYSEAEVKAEASHWTVPGLDPNTGETTTRPGTPTDYFPSPYANEVAASAANGGKVPPDLSLMAKAREGGAEYIHAILTGYADPATYTNEEGERLLEKYPDFAVPPGAYFNPYFSALNIGMPPPLTTPGQVTYADGTEATIDQMAQDVAAFLTWTAEPTLVRRRQTGWAVLGFLIFATVLAWLAKKQIWAAAKPKRED